MRTLTYVVHGFPPRQRGGTEWHSYLLAKEISKKQKVTVFSRDYAPRLRPYKRYSDSGSGIIVERINVLTRPIDLESVYSDERVKLSFDEYIRDVRPDLIHFQHLLGLGLGPLEVALDRGIPAVVSLHDFFLICHRVNLIDYRSQLCNGPLFADHCRGCIRADFHLRPELARRVGEEKYDCVGKLLQRVDRIIAPSRFVKKTFLRNLPQLRNIVVSQNGLKRFRSAARRRSISKALRIGYVGPLWRHKGVHILVEAFNRTSADDIALSIHGGGDREYLQELRKIARKRVLSHGQYRHEDLPRIMSSLDVVVFPSLCYESFSYTLWEAMSMQVPVIVSDIGAQAEAVRDGKDGYHFRVGDPERLAKRLDWIATHRQQLQTIRDNLAVKSVYRVGDQARDLGKLYERLIEGAIGRGRPEFSSLTLRVRGGQLLRYVSNLEASIAKKDHELHAKDEELARGSEYTGKLESQLRSKDEELARASEHTSELESQLRSKDEELQRGSEYTCQLESQLRSKDEELARASEHTSELESQLRSKEEEIQRASAYTKMLEAQIEEKSAEIARGSEYARKLEDELKAEKEKRDRRLI